MSLQAAGIASRASDSCDAPDPGIAARGRADRATDPSSWSGSSRSGPEEAAASPKTASNAQSNRSISACSEHSTVRSASFESSREPQSTSAKARCASSNSPTPTRDPCARNRPANDPSRETTASASDTFEHLSLADPEDVLVHLQRSAKRLVEITVATEREQRPRPHQRLADPRELVKVAVLAQPPDRRHDPRRDRLRHPRDACVDDRALAFRRGVVDPVIKAATLERVVKLTRPVGGQDHDRAVPGGDRAE